jgi:hypothetical protein
VVDSFATTAVDGTVVVVVIAGGNVVVVVAGGTVVVEAGAAIANVIVAVAVFAPDVPVIVMLVDEDSFGVPVTTPVD